MWFKPVWISGVCLLLVSFAVETCKFGKKLSSNNTFSNKDTQQVENVSKAASWIGGKQYKVHFPRFHRTEQFLLGKYLFFLVNKHATTQYLVNGKYQRKSLLTSSYDLWLTSKDYKQADLWINIFSNTFKKSLLFSANSGCKFLENCVTFIE